MPEEVSTANTTLIVGPGAVGRLLAMHLSLQVPVLLVGRRELGSHHSLVTPDGKILERQLHSLVSSQLSRSTVNKVETVYLTTKAYATEAALDSLSGILPPTAALVLWQNGFTVQPTISASWPGPVLCASTTEGAYINDSPDQQRVIHAGRGHTVIGDLDNHYPELATQLAQRLVATGMSAEAVADIRLRLWHKLAINAAINPLVARYRIRNGQLRDRPFRPMVTELIDEIQAVLAAEGIHPPSLGWHGLIWSVIDAAANNRASMLQDILAERPTEHAAILGPLCDAAERYGIPAPGLRALLKWLASRG
ncbi:MAG: ketopantoate reductase family protein [Halomonas sp.]|uniref:ketopantoate reductase family protein n=1 Tax=Halomonas sp. TaxID=1486246 RepID=UPI003F8E8928